MKRYFGALIIALAVILSSNAAYSAGIEKEITAAGIVPAEWGNLRSVEIAQLGSLKYQKLYFEDSKGTIRIVTLNPGNNGPYIGSSVVVIKRSK